ncbi:DUF4129 domain-containing protein [Stomatohabitans albus]|uniref:DUF4129 domain-containing protein n=1 Tax=Stomatohabitans albus TaxID=3110766 RepID=UPI00300D85BD
MIPASEIREAIEDILARSEFRGSHLAWYERLIDVVGTWIEDFLKLFDVDIPEEPRTVVASIVVIVGFLLALAIIIFLVYRIRTVQRTKRKGIEEDLGLTPAEWEQRYTQAVAEGDMHEAFRCIWRSTVAELDVAGRVTERRGLTTGEAVAEAGLKGDAFAVFTKRFEQAMYAGKQATGDDVSRAVQWRSTILEEVHSR